MLACLLLCRRLQIHMLAFLPKSRLLWICKCCCLAIICIIPLILQPACAEDGVFRLALPSCWGGFSELWAYNTAAAVFIAKLKAHILRLDQLYKYVSWVKALPAGSWQKLVLASHGIGSASWNYGLCIFSAGYIQQLPEQVLCSLVGRRSVSVAILVQVLLCDSMQVNHATRWGSACR